MERLLGLFEYSLNTLVGRKSSLSQGCQVTRVLYNIGYKRMQWEGLDWDRSMICSVITTAG